MATVAQNLQKLVTAKTNIRNAILQMGGTCPSSHGFEEFDDDILTINSGPPPLSVNSGSAGGIDHFNGNNSTAKTQVGFTPIKAYDLYSFDSSVVNYYKTNYDIKLTADLTIATSESGSSQASFGSTTSWISMAFDNTSVENATNSDYIVHSYTVSYVFGNRTLVSTNISATVPFISPSYTDSSFGIYVTLQTAYSSRGFFRIALSNVNVTLVHK